MERDLTPELRLSSQLADIRRLYAGGYGVTRIAHAMRWPTYKVRYALALLEVPRRPFTTKGMQTRLGAKLSAETREKIGRAHRGKTLTANHRREIASGLRSHYRGRLSSEHPSWKGGIVKAGGYVLVRMPDHPHAMMHGYVKRSHLVAEQKYGRWPAEGENVHHLNGIKDDDRPENLELMAAGEHMRKHRLFDGHSPSHARHFVMVGKESD